MQSCEVTLHNDTTHITHIQYIYNTYTTHIQYIHNTHTTHIQHTYNTLTTHIHPCVDLLLSGPVYLRGSRTHAQYGHVCYVAHTMIHVSRLIVTNDKIKRNVRGAEMKV